MAMTIVLGLAILSVANFGNTFEFSGLDPSVLSKTQIKPTIKPFSSFTNQPGQGDHAKPAFAGFKNVATKPFGPSFDSFKPSYQPYQPGPFRANYQPYGPYPGYPGPVVYPGQGGYPGPAAYPVPPQHFNDPNQRPFGFQPFPGSPQQPFNPFKFGSTKKFNKNLPGLAEINLPGKYFQEHQFGAYHGPEFSSAIVPAEHNLKQSKPKDTLLLGKPAVPALPELGFPKQNVFGFAPPPPSFRYPLPSFPPNQPFFNALPSATAGPATTAAADLRSDFGAEAVTVAAAPASSTPQPQSQDESATAQQPAQSPSEEQEVASSATPAADPQPAAGTGPAQEEAAEAVTAAAAAAVEASTVNNDVPAAVSADDSAKEQSEPQSDPSPSSEAEAAEPGASAVAQENDAQVPSAEKLNPVVVEQLKETSDAAAVPADAAAVPADAAAVPADAATVPADAAAAAAVESTGPVAEKSGEIKESFLPGIKPTEPAVASVNVPGLPNELFSPIGDVPVSVQPYLGASGYPYNFGQTADSPQPSFYTDYEVPKFTEEDLKRFEDSFRSGVLPQPTFQVFGDAPAVKIPGNAAAAAAGATSPTAQGGDASSAVAGSSTPSSVGARAQDGEKNEAVQPESPAAAEAPKKNSNTVQIIQEDPFNGQFPLLFDPSNAGAAAAAPLDVYGFYGHPSVSALSTQASLASYSPEDAFANFGAQYRQGYLVEGAPTLTPVTKTAVAAAGPLPVSISSKDHPLHSQVFRFSQSFVPYPEAAAAFRASSAEATVPAAVFASDVSSSTAASTTAAAAADSVVSSTTEAATVQSASSTTETTA